MTREPSTGLRKSIMWAITYECNLRCNGCYLFRSENSQSFQHTDAPPDIVENIAASLTRQRSWQPEIVWLTGGEPTLHPQLFWLIKQFESAGIMTVVTTNGVLNEHTAYSLIESRPRGIMVTLQLVCYNDDEELRKRRDVILNNVCLLVENKSKYTTLGISVIVTPENIRYISEFADFLQERKVEYLSLNPFDNPDKSAHDFNPLHSNSSDQSIEEEILQLSKRKSLLLPSSQYLELLIAHFQRRKPPMLVCPATWEYAFIAPWGQVYPCSCEFWHRDENMLLAPMASGRDFTEVLAGLQNLLKHERFTTLSTCYSTRCMGCWKLYYDAVFKRFQV